MAAVTHHRADGWRWAEQALDDVRLRLFDTMSDLGKRSLPTAEELLERLLATARELHDIERQLRLVAHIHALEADGIEQRVAEIEERIAREGLPARPVEDVIAELRRQA